jgi:phospholipase C
VAGPAGERHVFEGRRARIGGTVAALALIAATLVSNSATARPASTTPDAANAVLAGSPIDHVVIVYQENHSFDEVLGLLCAQVAAGTLTRRNGCDGATRGSISTGARIDLQPAKDLVPVVAHSVGSQRTAINGGAMDSFDRTKGCTRALNYRCYVQYRRSQIPNLWALADRYTISDRTFEFATTPSWAGHLVLATADLDGFIGMQPDPSTFTNQTGPGWGCDSFRDARWWNGSREIMVPSCIPDRTGAGPYRTSPVPYVPTIFRRMDTGGVSWKIYGGESSPTRAGLGYQWTICPTFFDCLGSSQRARLVNNATLETDAAAGRLPAVSFVTPTGRQSQHNEASMAEGDNWIGKVVSAIQRGPQWGSTAIFITYDDCGCFYDHVPPPDSQTGIRVPMVIVSPWAKTGFTDSRVATYSSMLAFIEHVFGLSPLNASDGNAYDYAASFDFTSPPRLTRTPMVQTPIPAWELAWLQAHPIDMDDPT